MSNVTTAPASMSAGPSATLRVGAFGEKVRQLQRELRRRGLYGGAIDGDFGGGTAAAVRAFQSSAGLPVTGIADPATLDAISSRNADDRTTPASQDLRAQPLATRCLALTAAFETGAPPPDCFGGVVGDFDGQGISFGALQWNLGQGTLQSLLADLEASGSGVLDEVFHEQARTLRENALRGSRESQLQWSRTIQAPGRRRLHEPWHGLFRALGRHPQCQAAQTRAARSLFAEAREWCASFGLSSERAVALMFDIRVQNGSISKATGGKIRFDFASVHGANDAEREVRRMEIVATRRAEAAREQFRADVLSRKLTIARGRGTVHGRFYNLEEDFGITLKPAGV